MKLLLNLNKTLSLNSHPEFIEGSSSHIQIVINRGSLTPGVYFVELHSNRVYRGKLIVE